MSVRYAVSLVLNLHLPYVREFPAAIQRSPEYALQTSPGAQSDPFSPPDADYSEPPDSPAEPAAETHQGRASPPAPENQADSVFRFPEEENLFEDVSLTPGTVEESWFFESLSETCIPLLMLFDRLEADHVPFRIGLSISPVFAQMLGDEFLQKKYAAYLDHQIDFGRKEMERLSEDPVLYVLAKRYFDEAVDRRAAFITRYEGNIFKALDHYQRKRRVEFLASPATHAFLPFLCPIPEAVQAQVETALSFYRYSLGINPLGVWLPELGWSKELDPILRSYGFNYTIASSHGFMFGNPPPSRGTFFPVRTPQGIVVLASDFCAGEEIAAMRTEGVYRDNARDIGYELPLEMLGNPSPFLAQNGARYQTGYKYWQTADGAVYDPEAAKAAAGESARAFLESCSSRLDSALQHAQGVPLSLCAFNADTFGRQWHEGPHFLESLFRLAAGYRELRFMTPSEYLGQQPFSSLEVSLPEFSSWGNNGYAEVWLDSSNDWMYCHLNRSIDRMVELADRFSKNSSLKERALNQGAREILLAMASDWPAFLYRQESTEYARRQVEDALRNFTTIYEALGSNYISTEWLTSLERRHDIFPSINYRVFKRKH